MLQLLVPARAAQGGSEPSMLNPVGCTSSPSPGQHCAAGPAVAQGLFATRGAKLCCWSESSLSGGILPRASLDIAVSDVGALEGAFPKGPRLNREG